MYLLTGTQAQIADFQQINKAIDSVSDIDSSAHLVDSVAGSLSVSYYSLIGWVVFVTIALAMVATATFYRTMRRRRQQDAIGSVVSSQSMVDEVDRSSAPSRTDSWVDIDPDEEPVTASRSVLTTTVLQSNAKDGVENASVCSV